MPRFASFAASAGLGAAFAAVAFAARSGQVLGSATGTEIALIIGGALIAAAAIVWGRAGGLSGAMTLALFALLTALTALSITWSVTPDNSWIETNRTLAYLAVFAAALGLARLLPDGWLVVIRGLLIGGTAIVLYALASRVWPATIGGDDIYSRLSQPLLYWNALGAAAAMLVPTTIWLGARRSGHAAVNALAYPLLSLVLITLFLTYSRGALFAAGAGTLLWLAIVPLRLRSVTVVAVSAAGAAPVLFWALSKKAFTASQVPLAVRERVADDFGVLLIVMTLLTLVAGLAIGFRIASRAPSTKARLRFGGAMVAIAVVVPVVMVAALITADPGIDQRISDLTNPKAAQQVGTARFGATSSSRPKYWKEAGQIFSHNVGLGTGAGTFGTARLPYRTDALVARQAHGFIPETMADLGLVGLVLIALLFVAWLVATMRALQLRPRDRGSPWTPERIGLVAIADVTVVYGIHSMIDWTWFIPAPTVMALAAAGFVAGHARPDPEAAPRARMLGLRVAAAGAVVLAALACAWGAWQPQRSSAKVNDAYDQIADGRFDAAEKSARDARDIDPLSLEAWWASASVADARGDQKGSEALLRKAIAEHRTDPRAWLRLAQYQLYTLDQPREAQKTIVDGVIRLDPNSREAAYAYFESRIRLRGGTAAAGAAPPTGAPAPSG